MTPSLFLFIVIVIEGYVVLSSELLAIRQLLPFVGSGTDTVSIIIAAVLMPLAFGYYAGGQFKPCYGKFGYLTYKRKLVRNILVSSIFLLIGLSFLTMSAFFETLISSGLTNRLVLTTVYALIFMVTPVFLLGQTVPLISNYFAREHLPQITGKVLFFSTVGSFLGAVFSTLVLMSFLGVHVTVMVNFVLLFGLVLALEKPRMLRQKKVSRDVINMTVITALALLLNAEALLRTLNVVAYNEYNMVRVLTDREGGRHFMLNNNASSKLTASGEKHLYINYIEKHFIDPLQTAQAPPQNILVIGAGGFTLGLEDTKNNYTFIDIDGDLKELAEKYFLPEKLGPNKKFEPIPARAFLTQTQKTYDLIVLDAYIGDVSIPEHLVTADFFRKVKSKLSGHGILVANFLMSPSFSNDFTRNIDATLRSVFPYVSRHIVINYNGWSRMEGDLNNVLYIYWHDQEVGKPTIYTDDKNTMFMDKAQKKPGPRGPRTEQVPAGE